jgi:uncharacterized protein
MARSIDYGNLMHRAMRGLIQSVLTEVSEHGLPGAHHFFITFDTTHPAVEMADWLRSRYPGEMTVVLQHWYDDLEVNDEGFGVVLNFGNQPERLRIPFDAVRTFVDPSVEFGLRFDRAGQRFRPPPAAAFPRRCRAPSGGGPGRRSGCVRGWRCRVRPAAAVDAPRRARGDRGGRLPHSGPRRALHPVHLRAKAAASAGQRGTARLAVRTGHEGLAQPAARPGLPVLPRVTPADFGMRRHAN